MEKVRIDDNPNENTDQLRREKKKRPPRRAMACLITSEEGSCKGVQVQVWRFRLNLQFSGSATCRCDLRDHIGANGFCRLGTVHGPGYRARRTEMRMLQKSKIH